jgi:hypothetical protein
MGYLWRRFWTDARPAGTGTTGTAPCFSARRKAGSLDAPSPHGTPPSFAEFVQRLDPGNQRRMIPQEGGGPRQVIAARAQPPRDARKRLPKKQEFTELQCNARSSALRPFPRDAADCLTTDFRFWPRQSGTPPRKSRRTEERVLRYLPSTILRSSPVMP